jgi:hypothetical protein
MHFGQVNKSFVLKGHFITTGQRLIMLERVWIADSVSPQGKHFINRMLQLTGADGMVARKSRRCPQGRHFTTQRFKCRPCGDCGTGQHRVKYICMTILPFKHSLDRKA